MRSGIVQGEDGAAGVTRRIVRLLVLLGAVVAAYLVLSLFDHGARADAGSIDQIGTSDPGASVEAVVAAAHKATPEPESIVAKSTAPKAHPQRIDRPTIKMPEVRPAKAQAPKKIQTQKIDVRKKVVASKILAPSLRVGETVQRAHVRTSKVRQATSDVVRDATRATVTPARTAVVRPKLPAPAERASRPKLPELPELSKAALASRTRLSDLPQAKLPALPQLQSRSQLPGLPQAALTSWTRLPDLPQAELPALPPSWQQFPGLPQAQLPTWPQIPTWSQLPSPPQAQLPTWPQIPSSPQLPVLPQAPTAAQTRTTALPSVSAPQPLLTPSASAQMCLLARPPAYAPTAGLSDVTKPPAARAQPRTAPLPAQPRQPADHIKIL